MVRKTKKIGIEGFEKTVEIKELRVRDIRAFTENKNRDISDILDELLKRCSNLSISDLDNFAPSELEGLYNAFMEVNSVFLKILDKTGIQDQIKSAFQADLNESLPGLSLGDTPSA